jgi:hypothetical protein
MPAAEMPGTGVIRIALRVIAADGCWKGGGCVAAGVSVPAFRRLRS